MAITTGLPLFWDSVLHDEQQSLMSGIWSTNTPISPRVAEFHFFPASDVNRADVKVPVAAGVAAGVASGFSAAAAGVAAGVAAPSSWMVMYLPLLPERY